MQDYRKKFVYARIYFSVKFAFSRIDSMSSSSIICSGSGSFLSVGELCSSWSIGQQTFLSPLLQTLDLNFDNKRFC